MDNITQVNSKYIFADGKRINSTPELLREVKTIAKTKYNLYRAMWLEACQVSDNYKTQVDKMPFHTESEISERKSPFEQIEMKLDNQYKREAVCTWNGMCQMAHHFSEQIDYWRKIHLQANRALDGLL